MLWLQCIVIGIARVIVIVSSVDAVPVVLGVVITGVTVTGIVCYYCDCYCV